MDRRFARTNPNGTFIYDWLVGNDAPSPPYLPEKDGIVSKGKSGSIGQPVYELSWSFCLDQFNCDLFILPH
ncbi:unnamed protein product [Onchocerca flexuosa]|uniref:Amidase domain-containing protein n=1 Tax=Onchocerca flexuosa TaxID=387005 RepID=A0A183HVQ1_9BILA|nr:unnamed protein product [Onchocerca flexuosa]